MSTRTPRRTIPNTTNMGTDLSEDILAEVDEPPDEVTSKFCWSPPNLCSGYMRPPPKAQRRESLLTRQLHSETEHTDNEELASPTRALSTQSTWSNISMPSTAELTSDDGHSMPSTAGSPPLPPTHTRNALAIPEKTLEQPVKIVGQEEPVAAKGNTEQTVEANLGRKRCISFACRGKGESKPVAAPLEPVQPESKSPPKRKCALKFICPSRNQVDVPTVDKPQRKRQPSPAPLERKPSGNLKHRGSDSTVTHQSPRSVRKVVDIEPTTNNNTPQAPISTRSQRFSDDSDEDSGNESTRFHAFATEDDEAETWTQMSTCHRNRLTVDDTLKKELVIRKTCEEVEEEVLEEEQEEEEEELDDELAHVAEMEDGEETGEADEDYDTDEGFHSDDEGGFASSDSDSGDESDFEWWKPGGSSTAATSTDQLDRLAIVTSSQPTAGTSVGSGSSSPTSPRSSRPKLRKSAAKSGGTAAMTIKRPASPGLPDTSDFVCGTLDEDRSLEEQFINRRKQKLAAKHPIRPQDIDPTFPTSDPEMDEEDEVDDIPEATQSGEESAMMYGHLDEMHGDGTARRRSPIRRTRTRSNAARSPAPTVLRHPSPAPVKRRATLHSPPPAARRSIARSPAPPRKLFGHSPNRMKSPGPAKRMTSPPNSPTARFAQHVNTHHGLAGRPQLTHTSSLPRGGPITFGKMTTIPSDDEAADDDTPHEIPKRGAIDIVKGLEKKRAWRKKKLAQKMCAKNANKGEKPFKVKPGIGAERMREVGLQLQEYHGKAEHILSL